MSMELLVRPAAVVPVLKSGSAPADVASQEDEATLSWGAGPLGQIQTNSSLGGGTSSLPDMSNWDDFQDQVPPDNPPVPTFQFDELARRTHTVRITSPVNPANWVDVEVIDEIAFNSQFGVFIYTFKNPGEAIVTGFDIGPFQNIVNVHWATSDDSSGGGPGGGPAWFAAHFWWEWTPGLPYTSYPCVDAPGPLSVAQLFTGTTDLKVSQFVPSDRAGFGGFYDVMTDAGIWLPPYDERLGHAGTPFIPSPFPAPGPYEFGVSGQENLSAPITKTLVTTTPLDTPPAADPTFNKQLSVHYLNHQNDWLTDPFCDITTESHVGTGYMTRVATPDAAAGWPYDMTGLRMVADAIMDFSGFSLTWLPTGHVYNAVALQTYASTGAGGRVIVLCVPAP